MSIHAFSPCIPEGGLPAFRFLVNGLLCGLPSGDKRARGDSTIPSKVLQSPRGQPVLLDGMLLDGKPALAQMMWGNMFPER